MSNPHWKALYHIEGVPVRPENQKCFTHPEHAAGWLRDRLEAAAETYEQRARDGEPGGLHITDGFAVHPVSWASAADTAREQAGMTAEVFAELDGKDPADYTETGPCLVVLGVNYVIEGCGVTPSCEDVS